MNDVKQEVVWYKNYESAMTIFEKIHKRIEDGWRIHACLERDCDVIIIYEKDLEKAI